MAKNPQALVEFINLRSGAIQGTPLTATDTDVLATDLKDAKLEGAKSGLFMASVEAADDGDADETYVIDLLGREDDAEAYVVLATITVPRGSTGLGLHSVPVDKFRAQLNYRVTVGGTTPSLTVAVWAVATEITYAPSDEVAVTA